MATQEEVEMVELEPASGLERISGRSSPQQPRSSTISLGSSAPRSRHPVRKLYRLLRSVSVRSLVVGFVMIVIGISLWKQFRDTGSGVRSLSEYMSQYGKVKDSFTVEGIMEYVPNYMKFGDKPGVGEWDKGDDEIRGVEGINLVEPVKFGERSI